MQRTHNGGHQAVTAGDPYLCYKRGTEKLLDWIVDTAQRISRKRGLQPHDAGSEKLQATHLLQLAAVICDERPPVNVPYEILFIAEDVIAGRKACAEYYSGLEETAPDDERERQNSAHRHFIKILEDITTKLKCLTDMSPPQKAQNVTTSKKAENELASINIYECLGIAETDEEMAAPDSGIMPSRSLPKASREAYVDTTSEDQALQIWAFLEDTADIRRYLKQVWSEYHGGAISISVAATLTDIALSNICALCKDLYGESEFLFIYEKLLRVLGIQIILSSGKLVTFASNGDARVERSSELLSFQAYNLLLHVRWASCQGLPSHLAPFYKIGPDSAVAEAVRASQVLRTYRPGNPGESRAASLIQGIQTDMFT